MEGKWGEHEKSESLNTIESGDRRNDWVQMEKSILLYADDEWKQQEKKKLHAKWKKKKRKIRKLRYSDMKSSCYSIEFCRSFFIRTVCFFVCVSLHLVSFLSFSNCIHKTAIGKSICIAFLHHWALFSQFTIYDKL